jgi:hypothetical protein
MFVFPTKFCEHKKNCENFGKVCFSSANSTKFTNILGEKNLQSFDITKYERGEKKNLP